MISQVKETIMIEEVLTIVNRKDRNETAIVRDSQGRIWEIPARPDVREEGVITDCSTIRVGMELVVDVRLMHVIAPETIAYGIQSPTQ